MKRIFSRICLAFMTFMIVWCMGYDFSYATEDETTGEIIPVSEPLNNSVPMIYGYQILPDGCITPGEEFTLRFQIYNPTIVGNVGNLAITVNQKDNLIYPSNGRTNSIYVGYLKTVQYREEDIVLTASKDIKDGNVPIDITLSYSDNFSTNNVQYLDAVLQVSQSGTLSVNSVDIPSSMYVGSNNRVSLTYSNDGLSTINNVKLHLIGSGIEEREISLGSLGSSTTVNSDVYIEFLEEGTNTVDMYFTYMDRDGQTITTETKTYTFNVESFDNPASQIDEGYLSRRGSINSILSYGALLISSFIVILYFVRLFIKKKDDKELSEGEKA